MLYELQFVEGHRLDVAVTTFKDEAYRGKQYLNTLVYAQQLLITEEYIPIKDLQRILNKLDATEKLKGLSWKEKIRTHPNGRIREQLFTLGKLSLQDDGKAELSAIDILEILPVRDAYLRYLPVMSEFLLFTENMSLSKVLYVSTRSQYKSFFKMWLTMDEPIKSKNAQAVEVHADEVNRLSESFEKKFNLPSASDWRERGRGTIAVAYFFGGDDSKIIVQIHNPEVLMTDECRSLMWQIKALLYECAGEGRRKLIREKYPNIDMLSKITGLGC